MTNETTTTKPVEDKYKDYRVDIHGKAYMTVAGRIKEFWDRCTESKKDGTVQTQVVYDEKSNEVRVEARVKIGESIAFGHASEIIGAGHINRTSALENCETSAVGRALGNMGIGLTGGVATADEIKGVDRKETAQKSWGGKASDKQKGYIKGLIKAKGKPEPDDEWFDTLTMKTAKASIDKLLSLPDVEDQIVNTDPDIENDESEQYGE